MLVAYLGAESKFPDVLGHYLTNKIPFLNVYGDINLVGHVIKIHYERFDHVTTRFIYLYTSKNGILFGIFPFKGE